MHTAISAAVMVSTTALVDSTTSLQGQISTLTAMTTAAAGNTYYYYPMQTDKATSAAFLALKRCTDTLSAKDGLARLAAG